MGRSGKSRVKVDKGPNPGKVDTSNKTEIPLHRVRVFTAPDEFGQLIDLREELDDMWDVLMGRVEAPIDVGVMTLMEVASSYHARAGEITARLQRMEADGDIAKGSPLYRFRTGELRTFTEVARAAIELGSRRVTQAKLEYEMSIGAI